jgi:hypothetical protein
LDTREKIVELSEAAKQFSTGEWMIVPGLFDPLTATQAKRLDAFTENGRKLAAIVLDNEQTLLSARARAALVAGLRSVNLVVIADPREWPAMLPASPHIRVVEDQQSEAARSAEFVQFVIGRQKSA